MPGGSQGYSDQDGKFACISPLRNQAKTVAWDYLKNFVRPIQSKPPNEAELYVQIHGGSKITLFGADGCPSRPSF